MTMPSHSAIASGPPSRPLGEHDQALDRRKSQRLKHIPWLSRVRHGTVRHQSGPIILMYHQVGIVENDAWSLAVSPRHFAEHLEVLTQRRHPVALREITDGLRSPRLDRLQSAITFDDGYADNLINAKPILERFGIPATVFIVGEAIGTEREFWWDALDKIFLGLQPLPTMLRLQVAGREQHWNLPADPGGSGLSGFRGTPRERLRRVLWGRLRGLKSDERWRLIGELQAWAGVPAAVRSDRRVMTEAEVHALAKGGLIEVGAHTASHPRLAALSAADQLSDIRRGKERLESILGAPVTSFSYPFGGRLDVSAASVDAVRKAGFARACTTRKGVLRGSTNLLRLPRIYVGDWSGAELERQLEPWL